MFFGMQILSVFWETRGFATSQVKSSSKTSKVTKMSCVSRRLECELLRLPINVAPRLHLAANVADPASRRTGPHTFVRAYAAAPDGVAAREDAQQGCLQNSRAGAWCALSCRAAACEVLRGPQPGECRGAEAGDERYWQEEACRHHRVELWPRSVLLRGSSQEEKRGAPVSLV